MTDTIINQFATSHQPSTKINSSNTDSSYLGRTVAAVKSNAPFALYLGEFFVVGPTLMHLGSTAEKAARKARHHALECRTQQQESEAARANLKAAGFALGSLLLRGGAVAAWIHAFNKAFGTSPNPEKEKVCPQEYTNSYASDGTLIPISRNRTVCQQQLLAMENFDKDKPESDRRFTHPINIATEICRTSAIQHV